MDTSDNRATVDMPPNANTAPEDLQQETAVEKILPKVKGAIKDKEAAAAEGCDCSDTAEESAPPQAGGTASETPAVTPAAIGAVGDEVTVAAEDDSCARETVAEGSLVETAASAVNGVAVAVQVAEEAVEEEAACERGDDVAIATIGDPEDVAAAQDVGAQETEGVVVPVVVATEKKYEESGAPGESCLVGRAFCRSQAFVAAFEFVELVRLLFCFVVRFSGRTEEWT